MVFRWSATRTAGVLAAVLACGTAHGAADAPHARLWSISDAIEMTTIVPLGDPADGVKEFLQQPWLYSPDAERFLLLLEKGDIERDVVVCELRLFSVKSIRAAAAARKPRTNDLGTTIARAESSTAADCMKEIRWSLDGTRVEFLAEAPDHTRQLFRYDTASGLVRQISFHPKGLLHYSSSPSRYVLSAWEPPSSNDQAVRAPFTVADEWVYTVVDPGRVDGGSLRYVATYATDEEGRKAIRIDEPTRRRYFTTWNYWISPDGRQAIGLRPPRRMSEHWKHYRPATDALALADKPEGVHPGVLQFVKIDLASGAVVPVFDALSGRSLQRGEKVEAVWSQDGRRVVLFNTFLPAPSSGEPMDNDPAIVELDVETGAWVKVRTLEEHSDAPSARVARRVTWAGDELEIAVDGGKAAEGRRQEIPERYIKTGDRWVRSPSSASSPRSSGGVGSIRLSIAEDCNRPPQLLASLPGRTSPLVLTNLNPQFDMIERSRVELIEWQDAEGRRWNGGLILPRGVSAGQKVPLVVQYWFNPKYFRPEGADTSAFAAASLASRGIAVLGVADPPGAVDASYSVDGATGAADLYRRGVESGIDHLVSRGIVDRDRIGLLGFSRSGYLAKYFLSHSSYPLRAVVIASSTDLGYGQYLTLVGEHAGWVRPGFEQANGGKPFWFDPQAWLRHAPGFNLRNADAALRLESYSRYEALYQWEHFAAYRILNRPVEMLVIPEGAHNLKKPSHRLLSQQGNVDWFAFWLKGEEDPANGKTEQYRRWRDLRALVPLQP